MTYPTSLPVSAGQPTASSQYNQLRADALYLGQPASDSVALGALMQRFEHGLRLEYLAVNRLRVPANPAAPVSLVINGCMLLTVNHVDLPSGSVPTGPEAVWYVFALQSAGTTGFTLDINTSPGESSNRRCIGSFYWDGSAIAQNSIRTETSDAWRAQLPYVEPLTCQGRLTLVSGDPAPGMDVTAAGTLYFTPFHGNQAALYTPLGWRVRAFSELSLSLAGLTSAKNYDIFLVDQAGTLTLQTAAWTADTTRASALAWQDGVAVQSGALQYRYLGTIRTSASGQCEDSQQKRFVWNACNRRVRSLRVVEPASSWTYSARTLRPFNNNTANRVEFLLGLLEDVVQLNFCGFGKGASAAFYGIGLGLDSIIADSPQVVKFGGGSTNGDGLNAVYNGLPAQAGYHYLQLLEIGASGVNITFYGNRGLELEQSGASGFVMA